MIDLDAASAELGESLNHVRPDVDAVRARAARRQRARRIVGGLAALLLLAGGAAAAAAVVGDEEASEGVFAGPGPEGTGDHDPEPTDPVPRILVPVPIELPCGSIVVPNRSTLDVPARLDVPVVEGMGGWAPGTSEGICAVHLTDPDDPASHVTFADGALPFAIATELGGATVRSAGVRWGTIEDGFGAQVTRGSDQFHVLAYGLSEEEAAALFTSLALG